MIKQLLLGGFYMERKYLFEAGLSVFTSFKTIISVENLTELQKYDDHLYHIYGILAYKKIYFKKEKTRVIENGIEICLFAIINNQEVEYPLPLWEISSDLDYSKVELTSLYPHTFIKIKINDTNYLNRHPEITNPVSTLAAQTVFNKYAEHFVKKQEYEVLYIGQAFGKNGNRTAFDRLASHSTLQKILTEQQTKYPDKHLYIMLLEFTTNLSMSFDGLSKQYSKSIDESDQHMREVLCNLPKDDQVINITEAALINYFKPTYNVTYVENFPNKNHKGYKQYFDLDYNSLVVELDMEFDNSPIIQLYTKTSRVNSPFDFIRYTLHNDSNRKSMYDIFT